MSFSVNGFSSADIRELKSQGYSEKEIRQMMGTTSALDEAREKMRNLSKGAPLGIDYRRNNYCYLASAMQIVAHVLNDKTDLLIVPCAADVARYCDYQNRRLVGHEASIEADPTSIVTHIGVIPGQQEVSDAVLPRLFQNQDLCIQALEYKERQDDEIDLATSLQIDSLRAVGAENKQDKIVPEIISVRGDKTLARIDENFTYLENQYVLKGAFVHVGKKTADGYAVSGHYVAYIAKDGKYYECNDSRVKELTCVEYMKEMRNPTTSRIYAKVGGVRASSAASEQPALTVPQNSGLKAVATSAKPPEAVAAIPAAGGGIRVPSRVETLQVSVRRPAAASEQPLKPQQSIRTSVVKKPSLPTIAENIIRQMNDMGMKSDAEIGIVLEGACGQYALLTEDLHEIFQLVKKELAASISPQNPELKAAAVSAIEPPKAAAAMPAAGGSSVRLPSPPTEAPRAPVSSPPAGRATKKAIAPATETVSAAVVATGVNFYKDLNARIMQRVSSGQMSEKEAWDYVRKAFQEKADGFVERFTSRDAVSEEECKSLYNELLDFKLGVKQLGRGNANFEVEFPDVDLMINGFFE
ncbi:MAG TPA: ubiquitin carboxyl-terminal hydrolase family protein [Chlamydiales bacterium]|nr:ubiquitin carboxyl-terminal hydrolase family protein [Chlamydiales bacterium]